MKRQMMPKKWITSFLCLVLAVLLLLSAAAWVVDPYLQFRIRDNAYLLSGRFVDAGLIRNYDYDTLMIGSSMTQNFDMELFRSEMGCKPLHVSLGGLNADEMDELVQAAYAAGKAETLYLCVDLSYFTDEPEPSQFPPHLFRTDPLSRLRYLLSYEVWFRYLPIDLGLLVFDRLGLPMPRKFADSRSIDRLENWSGEEPVGEDVFLHNVWVEAMQPHKIDEEAVWREIQPRIDAFLNRFDFDYGRHIFFFPPYSCLFWYNSYFTQYFRLYQRAKIYFVERADAMGAEVFDFQSAPFTADMSIYRDVLHYGPEINDWMTRCFASGDYRATAENIAALQEPIAGNTERFMEHFMEVWPPA
ncbi:MAG: hypothetical protein IJ705_03540 [Oscillospiraceae bacterium]|nr:hypothetical protein [Oscillospiraceae bacterium]